MPVQDSYQCLVAKAVKTDTASTDAYILPIPYTGKGYAVRRVTVYNSRLGTTGATANGATATLSVYGAAAAGGAVIVADAALTGLTGSTIVLYRTVAATALTPLVTAANLYIRVGTASGVANSVIDVQVEYSVFP
jgi:hypothetical protein